MKRLFRRRNFLVLTFIFTLLFCFPSDAKASRVNNENSYGYEFTYYDYVLDNYDVNIVVNEDNTYMITETIDAYFKIGKHGIYRKIPLKNEVVRQDGTISHNRAKVSNISVNEDYTISTENGYRVIKIGDANYTLTGPKSYTISYLYNLGKDTSEKYDEFYFDLIGNEWDTTISGITFTITMPKEFDQSLLGFSSGKVGSTNSSNVSYKVDGNVITGQYLGILNPGEALTIRLELPEGYYVGASNNLDFMMILSIGLPILFALITFVVWFKFGKDNPVIETVEFYPPTGFNSAEIGFLYKGRADKNDVISLLIYLANKGYIKIIETEEESLFTKVKGFKIVKLKDYDGEDANERLFLNGLFSSKSTNIKKMNMYMKNSYTLENDSTSQLCEVTSHDLYNNFYITLNSIMKNLNQKDNIHKIFENNSFSKGLYATIVAIFLLITVRPVYEYGGAEMLPFGLLFPGLGFSFLFVMVFGKTPVFLKAFGLVWGLGFGGIPWSIIVLPALLADSIYMFTYFLGILCIIAIVLLLKAMPKRTDYGNEMLGKLKGFKNFLETVEKPKLESMVMQDPSYFYDILPYTYVLGISDKWIKKFEAIALQAPDWYDGRSAFSPDTFGHFMNRTMTSASKAMSSSPSSSGSGGSGGGSSGGGSGGGGGGSW